MLSPSRYSLPRLGFSVNELEETLPKLPSEVLIGEEAGLFLINIIQARCRINSLHLGLSFVKSETTWRTAIFTLKHREHGYKLNWNCELKLSFKQSYCARSVFATCLYSSGRCMNVSYKMQTKQHVINTERREWESQYNNKQTDDHFRLQGYM